MTPINNQNGFSSVAAVMTLILLSITGWTVGYLTAVGEEEKPSQLSGAEAYYIAHAGSEHAIKKMAFGLFTTVVVMALFAVATNALQKGL